MAFLRPRADNWRSDVPGARWFKADLHVRTIDDAPGSLVQSPGAGGNPPDSEEELRGYARRFLQTRCRPSR
ncbi:MAG: hypothetical protein OXE79_09710 [Acidimicrobiaceae bacterium]|nr:hypothetical protein [Acidimicrobiaceae bacterium]MCY4280071.1 hypothetical protein [Acidimicrobiaceae bacterium]